MQIKTIVNRLDNCEQFDNAVNNAASEGWVLTKREVLLPLAQPNNGNTYTHIMLYAELQKS